MGVFFAVVFGIREDELWLAAVRVYFGRGLYLFREGLRLREGVVIIFLGGGSASRCGRGPSSR